jgi:hypothetical protein
MAKREKPCPNIPSTTRKLSKGTLQMDPKNIATIPSSFGKLI